MFMVFSVIKRPQVSLAVSGIDIDLVSTFDEKTNGESNKIAISIATVHS